jgi:3-oxoacyl-[acyl-carrier protein] reductase
VTSQLQGRTALVTGASRGIGRAIAIRLAEQGAQVVVSYLKNQRLADEVVETIVKAGGTALAAPADLSRPAEVADLFDNAEQTIGALDIVIANAADMMEKPLEQCTEEDYDRIFGTNTKGVFFILQQAARRLNDGGRIIVTSTGGTRMFFANQSLYLGSKGAVEQFVRGSPSSSANATSR